MRTYISNRIKSSTEPKILYAIVESDSPTDLYQCPTCGSEYISDQPAEKCPFCGSDSPPIIKGFITEG